MKEKQLFNPNADDRDDLLIGGNITNILNTANIKHPEYIKAFETAYSNNWIPQKVSNMSDDKYQYYHRLTPEDKKAFNDILSFLIFMDSIQTNNLPNIASMITIPEIVGVLARQAYDEFVHSFSYGYIIDNMVSVEEKNEIVYAWKKDPILLERNESIAKIYQDNKSKNSYKSFLVVAMANYQLEGVYFYNGFNFFHNLASRNLMLATNTQIAYIKRDELVHCTIFKNILKLFKKQFPKEWDEDLLYKMMEDAVKHELRFSNHVIGDKILGMSSNTIENYTYYLANNRLKDLGLNEIFPKRENPYKHLDRLASIEREDTNKQNTLETSAINYKSPEIIDGWDDLMNKEVVIYK